MKRLVCAALCLLSSLAVASAQTVSFTATHISTTGGLLGFGQLCTQPVDASNHPLIAKLGGGGALTIGQACATVTNGVLASFSAPDTSTTIPLNVCLRVTITDVSGKAIYTATCVQPAASNYWCAGGVCNFDNFAPSSTAIPLVQAGPTGPQGPAGAGFISGLASDAANGIIVSGDARANNLYATAALPAGYYKIAAWGDSLTAGSGGTPYPSQMVSLLPVPIYNGGISGETSTSIKTRMLAATDKYGYIGVIWAGRNNYTSASTVLADDAAMVAALTVPRRFVVLSVINNLSTSEMSGGSNYNTIASLNASLASTYPNNYLDVRSALIAAYNPGNAIDVINRSNGQIPSSLHAGMSGTLTGSMTSGSTSIALTYATGTPLVGMVLEVDSEMMIVSGVAGSTVTVSRGDLGSVAAAHSTGAAFFLADATHLNTAGYLIVAQQVAAWIKTNVTITVGLGPLLDVLSGYVAQPPSSVTTANGSTLKQQGDGSLALTALQNYLDIFAPLLYIDDVLGNRYGTLLRAGDGAFRIQPAAGSYINLNGNTTITGMLTASVTNLTVGTTNSIINNGDNSFKLYSPQYMYWSAPIFKFFDNASVLMGTFTKAASDGAWVMTPNVKLRLPSTLELPNIKATTGTRYVCIDTTGNLTSSATACSGT